MDGRETSWILKEESSSSPGRQWNRSSGCPGAPATRARVAAVDIRQESLDETIGLAAAGDRLVTVVADITDRNATESLPAKLVDALGAVDVVINVAGIIPTLRAPGRPLLRGYRAGRQREPLRHDPCRQGVPAPTPRASGCPPGQRLQHGRLPPRARSDHHGATKAAVTLVSEGLYAELLDTNVGVSVIMTGAVETEITAHPGWKSAPRRGRGTPDTRLPLP